MTLPAAGWVVTPVTATVVRTAAATSPGCLARNVASSCFRGLQATVGVQGRWTLRLSKVLAMPKIVPFIPSNLAGLVVCLFLDPWLKI